MKRLASVGVDFSPSFEVQKKMPSGSYRCICAFRSLNRAIRCMNGQKQGDYRIIVVLFDSEIERLILNARKTTK